MRVRLTALRRLASAATSDQQTRQDEHAKRLKESDLPQVEDAVNATSANVAPTIPFNASSEAHPCPTPSFA